MAKRNEDEIVLDYLLQSISQAVGHTLTETARAHEAAHAQGQRRIVDLETTARTHEQGQRRIVQLETEVAAVKGQLADLTAQLAETNRVLTIVSGMWTRENHPGLQTEDDNRHHDLAAEYEQFRDDEVFSLVIAPTRDGRALSHAQQAHVYSLLSREIFGSPEPTPDGVRRVLHGYGLDQQEADIEGLCRRAADITSRAARLGRNHRWDFERGDGRFDTVRQKRYAASASGAPDEIVTIVAAPAYVVGDGKVVRPQVVFTERAAHRGADGFS